MLVFRCECEQVLGVEDDSKKGGMGECPTCGRIIRVPMGLVNASGRLKLIGTPARASSPSGAYRQIRESARSGAVGSAATAPAPILNEPAGNTTPAESPVPAFAQTIAASIDSSVPMPSTDATPSMDMGASNLTTMDPSPDAATEESLHVVTPEKVAAAASASFIPLPTTKSVPVPARKGVASKKPTPSQKSAPLKTDANDPNAALETKGDKNLAANAAAVSKRKKAEPAVAPPAKKSFLVICMVAVVLVLVAAGVLYAMGVFNNKPKPQETKPSTSAPLKTVTTPVSTPETKAATTPETSGNSGQQPSAEPKKDETKAEAGAEKKADENKTTGAENKVEEKKP